MINPLKELQDYADEWYTHYQANDWQWCSTQDVNHLADLVATLDLALTGHPRQVASRSWDVRDAVRMLEGDIIIVQLSDGGYSRLIVDFPKHFGEPIRLDKSASLPKAIENWDRLRSPK